MDGHQRSVPRRRVLAGVGTGVIASLIGVGSSIAQTETTQTGEDVVQLGFGETFVSPEDIAVTVDGIELEGSYEYTLSGDTYTEESPEGSQFAWVSVAAENRGDQPEYLPFRDELPIRTGDQQYNPEYPPGVRNVYESGEVGPGVVREGLLLYVIPADLTVPDLNVTWYGEGIDSDWTVTWSGEATASPGAATGTSTGNETENGNRGSPCTTPE